MLRGCRFETVINWCSPISLFDEAKTIWFGSTLIGDKKGINILIRKKPHIKINEAQMKATLVGPDINFWKNV